MTVKRIRPQQSIKFFMPCSKTKFFISNREMRRTYNTETDDTQLDNDRLTNLPESLQLHILSKLYARTVVRTSVLSKSWVSLWKSVPILRLSSYAFKNVTSFDRFVEKLVCQSMNVDTLIFKRERSSTKKILEKVISFARSSNVKHLDVSIQKARLAAWPVFSHGYDSLKSLKLRSKADVLCSYLGPQARLFKNLSELYLQNATIHDLDAFSGFRVLNKLTLSSCKVDTSGNTLNIHSEHLSELTISGFCVRYCDKYDTVSGSYKPLPVISCIKLMTPRLRMFEYEGYDFPMLETCDGLPNLYSVAIGYPGNIRVDDYKKQEFDNLMKFFSKVYNVKLLKVCPAIVYMLGLHPAELKNRRTPFQDLESLTLDYGVCYLHSQYWRYHGEWMFERQADDRSNAKDFLLSKSPGSEFKINL